MEMIDAVQNYFNSLSSHMDYDGQRLSERLFQVILTAAGVIGFVVGFVTQQLSYTVYAVLGGFAICCVLILPPWPFVFRRQQLKWLPVKQQGAAASSSSTESHKKKKK